MGKLLCMDMFDIVLCWRGRSKDCPAFQRRQISVFCVGESLDRFFSLINTTLKQISS